MSKTAIITGANKGIGLAVAKSLISKNYEVILACRDISKGKMAQEFLGRSAKFLELDLSRPSSISQFVNQINSDYSEIDVFLSLFSSSSANIDRRRFVRLYLLLGENNSLECNLSSLNVLAKYIERLVT